jgi:glyoxylase-like metal-dependent hydrolase (beta-lactamase superfamily II)
MITRRQSLLAAAALPVAALAPAPLRAGAPFQGTSAPPPFFRFRLGAFEVTTLLADSLVADKQHENFGVNVSAEEFARVSAEARIPADRARFYFTPTLVNTGAELVLFDTGLDAAGITAALQAAGHTPDQVDAVVITHMHPDHIGGLAGEAGATFANARLITGSVEHNFWTANPSEAFTRAVVPLNDRFTFVDDADTAAPGLTAMATFGHSPGHMAWMVESEGQHLLLTADLANHYVWSLGYPDWEVRFDADKAAAAAQRRKVLGMLAADGVPMVGYHMPFPGLGYVETRGDGFRFQPASYQFMLDGEG